MKSFFFILTILYTCATNVHGQKQVTATEFKKLLGENSNVQLIDVRTPEEFQEGHIPNSKNINLFDDDFEKRLLKYNKSKPIFVYCEVGGRSGEAAALLSKSGYSNVYDLKGGMRAWKKEKLPVE